MVGQVDLPAGVDEPHHHPGDVGGEFPKVGFGPDRREGLPVDLTGIAEVVEHGDHPTAGRSRSM